MGGVGDRASRPAEVGGERGRWWRCCSCRLAQLVARHRLLPLLLGGGSDDPGETAAAVVRQMAAGVVPGGWRGLTVESDDAPSDNRGVREQEAVATGRAEAQREGSAAAVRMQEHHAAAGRASCADCGVGVAEDLAGETGSGERRRGARR